MNTKIKWHKSICFHLLKWFLLLSLVPIIIISILAYKSSSDSLYIATSNQLEHSAHSYVNFINNWFDFRITDIRSWSSNSNSVHFMNALDENFKTSNKTLPQYIKSFSYISLIDSYQNDIIELTREYNYIYNLFLIDTKGNILFSVAKEDDLGTNLIHGKYASTLFAQTFKKTLSDGEVHFSDFEIYGPSDAGVYGFLTAPIISEDGDSLGVYAVQIRPDNISNQFASINIEDNGILHYLLGGTDLILRTSIGSKKDILQRHIQTSQTDLYQSEHVHHMSTTHAQEIVTYTGPNHNEVIGKHHPISVLGVQWVLISEMNKQKAFKASYLLAYDILFIAIAAMAFVFISSISIAKRITKPIQSLAEASEAISSGQKREPVWVEDKNEIGQFADAFNNMIEELSANEAAFIENAKEREYSLMKLKENELHLIRAKEEAEAGAKSKAEFLASMSHEIRTPMNGVLGMLGLIKNSNLDEIQAHQISLAESSAQSLLGLINDILDFSKVEAGKMELENLAFNLRDEIGNFAEGIGHRAQENGVELILDLIKVEHQLVICDPGRLRQILNNLVGNAIKFTHNGEVLITAILKEHSSKEGQLYISIKDTGIGIPKEKMADLFESFTQVDASTTRKYGGTGLGLSISKKLAHLMGGSVNVSSIEGEGSTFSFNIKVGLHKDKNILIPHLDIKGKRILIIDDNALNREVISGQFKHWRMKIFEADDSNNALMMCKKNAQESAPPFDIAIVDMHMPEMDGATLGKELKQLYPQMKLVLMTSLGKRGDSKTFKEVGFSAFFPKPCTTRDLLHTLNVLIDDDADALHDSDGFISSDNLHAMTKDNNWPDRTHILLVEDNITNQIVAKGILAIFSLQVDTANNGEEALSALKDALRVQPYTLILMDCQMPILDGYSTTEAIRKGKAGEENKKIPIIAMTANTMHGDKEKCLHAGMDDYISKPINADKLQEVLQRWLS